MPVIGHRPPRRHTHIGRFHRSELEAPKPTEDLSSQLGVADIGPGIDGPVAPAFFIEPQEQTMSVKLSTLAADLKAATAEVEAEAVRAHSRLLTAKDKALAGVGKIDSISAGIEAAANDIDDFANQISNGGPPL